VEDCIQQHTIQTNKYHIWQYSPSSRKRRATQIEKYIGFGTKLKEGEVVLHFEISQVGTYS